MGHVSRSYDVDASKELVALGAANVFGGVFGSFPVMCARRVRCCRVAAAAWVLQVSQVRIFKVRDQ